MYRQSGPARLCEHGEAAGAHAGTRRQRGRSNQLATDGVKACARRAASPGGDQRDASGAQRVADASTATDRRRVKHAAPTRETVDRCAAPQKQTPKQTNKQKPKTATDKEKRRTNEGKPNKRTRDAAARAGRRPAPQRSSARASRRGKGQLQQQQRRNRHDSARSGRHRARQTQRERTPRGG